jgi:fluoroacetyl-CoA thioesterase
MIENIKVGLVGEGTDEVTREKSAAHIGSGNVGVYATPQMVLLVERISHDLLAKYLSPGEVSVGVEIELKHLAPTPIGDTVHARCEITEVNGNRFRLHAEMWDSEELVGIADHQRVVIKVKRFLDRVEAKAASL